MTTATQTPSRFFVPFFCVAALGALIPMAINIWIDPARVLPTDLHRSHPGGPVNVRFLKVAHAIEDPKRFDSFVFGSSRIRYGIPVTELGDNWLKLDFPGGTPAELLRVLPTLKENGVEVREVWAGIDDFALYDARDLDGDFYLRHYPRSLLEWADFYRFYLFRRPREVDWKFIKRLRDGKPALVRSERIVGERDGLPTKTERKLERELRMGTSFAARRDLIDMPSRADDLLREVEELRAYARREEIELSIFLVPVHYKTLLYRDHNELDRFKRELAAGGTFYDFSVLSSAYASSHLWHETTHFSPAIGSEVVRALRDQTGDTAARSTGRRVSAADIGEHLSGARQALVTGARRLLHSDPALEIHESLLAPDPPQAFAVGADTVHSLSPRVTVREVEGGVVLQAKRRASGTVRFKFKRPRPRGRADTQFLELLITNPGRKPIPVQFGRRDTRKPVRMIEPGENRVFTPLRHRGVPSGTLIRILKPGTIRLEQARIRSFK